MTTMDLKSTFTVRRIVITGVLGAIAILLGVTRLGFIPVPNLSGNATIMHVPAIIGGVLEGPIVGLLIGGIFGIYSWIQDTTGIFKNPLVSVLPRLLIGVAAYFTYAATKKTNEYLALILAAVAGTLTNTILVVGAILLFTFPALVAVAPGITQAAFVASVVPQAVAEIIIAAVITVAVVAAWKRIETGRGKSSV
jgi:uncharacterized membrane protein